MELFVGFGVRFLLICWSRSLLSNYKIETKNDARVKCDFDVTIGFPNLVSQTLKFSESEFRILEKFRSRTEVGIEFVGVGVESESEIRDSVHLWWPDISRSKRLHDQL